MRNGLILQAQLGMPFFLQVAACPKTPYVVLDTTVSASIQNPAQSHLLLLELALGARKPAVQVCVETPPRQATSGEEVTKVGKTHSCSVSEWPKTPLPIYKGGPDCSSINGSMENRTRIAVLGWPNTTQPHVLSLTEQMPRERKQKLWSTQSPPSLIYLLGDC